MDFAISITAIILSIIGLLVSITTFFLTYRHSIILSIENKLTSKAIICNSYIFKETQGHPLNTQEVSAVITTILLCKDQLQLSYKNYPILLLFCNQSNFVLYFKSELHSSILELIKNQIPNEVSDINLKPIIQKQQLACRKFLLI